MTRSGRGKKAPETSGAVAGYDSREEILITDHQGQTKTSIHGNGSTNSRRPSLEDMGIMKTVEIKQTLM